MATVTCTLTLKSDRIGVYEDDAIRGVRVEAPLGGTALERQTAKILSNWVATHGDLCRRPELQILGRHLFEIAFGGVRPGEQGAPLGQAFQQTVEGFYRMGAGGVLRLRLVIDEAVQELAALPWEFLYMPWEGSGFFLAGGKTQLVLTRYIPNRDDVFGGPSTTDDSLRILIVKSQPTAPGLDSVDDDGIVEQVEGFASDAVAVESLDSPSRDVLRTTIGHWRPHVVHLMGHGRPGEIALRADADELARRSRHRTTQQALTGTEPAVDEADWVDADTVCALLRQGLDEHGGPGRLVFLHACHGASEPPSAQSLSGFDSVARALARSERIAAVVAMQYAIENGDAKRFAQEFYRRLFDQMAVDEAVTWARHELGEAGHRGHQAWSHRNFGTPVIYLRSSDPFFRRAARPVVTRVSPQQGQQLQVRDKEFCPNPYCEPGVLVFRAKKRCGVCKASFIECPACADGLVVAIPGLECTRCDYEYVADGDTFGTRSPGPRRGPARSASEPARPVRPESLKRMGIVR
ncbi:CHAT domain-containing protein [Cryptosporangium aurantiacum]|uniref:CHAT domain-containing protein n=1 Tax=Cryptosporangium aurantiacum TaxID=134849 RepID=A0A1M7KUW8_9ACTN|nr:CHAT domain-containing protein [Cryptosporangium aurantiacum]SHM69266.1 CHAT domain-containing protein [Cryptosporangium aurantiacum]